MSRFFTFFIFFALCGAQNISSFLDNISNFLPDNSDQLSPEVIANITEFLSINYNQSYEGIVREVIGEIIKGFNDKWQDVLDGDSECYQQFRLLGEGLTKREMWAIEMVDAMAKPQSGLLQGNIMHIGNFDECFAINKVVEGIHHVSGQYCSAMISLNEAPIRLEDLSKMEIMQKLFLSYGLCVPKECFVDELNNIFSAASAALNISMYLKFDEHLCFWEGRTLSMTTGAIITICIFSLIGITIILSTIYDIFIHQRKANKKLNIYTSFSAYTNGKKLLSISSKSQDNLYCLNGIRVISMIWIITAHRFIGDTGQPAVNAKTVHQKMYDSPLTDVIGGATYAVDTFFTVSGILVVYGFLKAVDKGQKFSIPMFYVHRILRLTPSLLMLILLYTFLTKYIMAGPFYYLVELMYSEVCERYWWAVLLYIQNYVHADPGDMCAIHTWYLAVDTQLYFVAPLLLLALVRWPKKTLVGSFLVALASIIYAFFINWNYEIGLAFFDQTPEQYGLMFTPTHVRIPPWLFGAICGYFLFEHKRSAIKLNQILVYVLWIFSILVMLLVIFGQHPFIKKQSDILSLSIYNALCRPSWGLAICIIVFLCVTGHGGKIDYFLSANIFTILCRLNYSVYLLHMFLITSISVQQKAPGYISFTSTFHQIAGDYTYTLFVGFFWTLAFESPIIALEKVLLSKGKARPSPSEDRLEKISTETAVIK